MQHYEVTTQTNKTCKHCGIGLGTCSTTRNAYITSYFLDNPKKINGVDYYRVACCACFFDKYKQLPSPPNRLTRNELEFFLEVSKDVIDERIKGNAITLENFIKKYGEKEGTRKFNDYREKQRVTNTLEYKQEKYGWTQQQFDDYNNSRAVTLANMISRYGDVAGRKKFAAYCERQSYAGCSREYFIEKYCDVDLGSAEFDRVNKSKALTLNTFIKKYGDVVGTEKYMSLVTKRAQMSVSTSSRISNELFDMLYSAVYNGETTNIMYSSLNSEHAVIDKENGTLYFLDFYDSSTNRVIEFYGSYWHMSPTIYGPDVYNDLVGKYAKEIWEYDAIRHESLKKQGYDILYVWEHEFLVDKLYTVDMCKKFLLEGIIPSE